MLKVFKYTLAGSRSSVNTILPIGLPPGAKVLHCDLQGTSFNLWALVDPHEQGVEERKFVIAGTGHYFINPADVYINTILDGAYVWHFFEVGR